MCEDVLCPNCGESFEDFQIGEKCSQCEYFVLECERCGVYVSVETLKDEPVFCENCIDYFEKS